MRTLGSKGVVWVCLGLLLGLLGYSWREAGRYQQPGGEPARPDSPFLGLKMVFRDHTEIIRNKRGEIIWKLYCRLFELDKEGTFASITGLEEATYFKDEKPLASLRADWARVNHHSKNIQIGGQVEIMSEEGLLLAADELRWLDREKKLVCPKLKTAQYRAATLDTQRLYYFPDEQKIECPDPLKLTYHQNRAQGQRVTVYLNTSVFELAGPAEVSVMVTLQEEKLKIAQARPRRTRWGTWLGAFALLGGTPVAAAEAPPPPPAAAGTQPTAPKPAAKEEAQAATPGQKATDEKPKKVHIKVGEGGTIRSNFETEETHARKNVVVLIPEDEVEIYCDRVDYTGKETGIVTATGNLKMKDPENVLTGRKVTVYTKEKRAVIEGDVRLVHTPKKKEEQGKKETRADRYRYEPTTMTCEKVEYFYKKGQRRGTATGNLKFAQKDRTGRAKEAVFYNEDQIVDLKQDVEFHEPLKGGRERWVKSPLVRILLEEDTVIAQGPLEIEFYLEEEEGEAAPAEAEKAAPPGPQAPPFPGLESPEEGGEEPPPGEPGGAAAEGG